MIRLLVKEIKDTYVLENFRRLKEYINAVNLLDGQFTFREITIPAGMANFRYSHKMGFKPRDVIQTSLLIAPGDTFTWNYDLFTTSFLDITTTGTSPVTVRAFIGSYTGGINA